MKVKRKKGFFSISAVAKMFSVHQQTIRLYEKQGLIIPQRSSGGTRLFSEEDIDRLEDIIYLTHELGINLAGVEMVLKLKKQVKKMQSEMNKLFESTQEKLDLDIQASKQMIQKNTQQLMKMKRQTPDVNLKALPTESTNGNYDAHTATDTNSTKQAIDVDEWEIEYEE